jgi:hypothetical protein
LFVCALVVFSAADRDTAQHITADSSTSDSKSKPFSSWFVVMGGEGQILAHRLTTTKEHIELEPLLRGLKERYQMLVRYPTRFLGPLTSHCAGQSASRSCLDRPVLCGSRNAAENISRHLGESSQIEDRGRSD